MAVARKRIVTPAEYLALEEKSDGRHEYWNGEIYAMSGSTATHNRITLNLVVALERALAKRKRACSVFATDLRLALKKSNAYTYPDIMVICGKLEFDAGRDDVVLNPTVIIEVLSDSTEKHDRTTKFGAYRQIASLQEYVLVDQHRAAVECFRKSESKLWLWESAERKKDSLKLQSLDIEIPLTAIYERVEFKESK